MTFFEFVCNLFQNIQYNTFVMLKRKVEESSLRFSVNWTKVGQLTKMLLSQTGDRVIIYVDEILDKKIFKKTIISYCRRADLT